MYDGVLLYSILSQTPDSQTLINTTTVDETSLFNLRRLPHLLFTTAELKDYILLDSVNGFYGKLAIVPDLKIIETVSGHFEVAVVKRFDHPTI